MRLETTRRGLLRHGLAAGALGSAAGELVAPGGARAAAATAPTDAQLLRELLVTEQLAVYSYQRILASDLLTPRTARIAARILGQEHAHVRALSAELSATGGAPPRPPASVAEADRQLTARKISQGIEQLTHPDDGRRLLIALEGVLEGYYYTAIGLLREARTLRTAAAIMADEAQHEVLLRLPAHQHAPANAVPSGLVQGTLGKKLAGSLVG
jgi:hypothetical protein